MQPSLSSSPQLCSSSQTEPLSPLHADSPPLPRGCQPRLRSVNLATPGASSNVESPRICPLGDGLIARSSVLKTLTFRDARNTKAVWEPPWLQEAYNPLDGVSCQLLNHQARSARLCASPALRFAAPGIITALSCLFVVPWEPRGCWAPIDFMIMRITRQPGHLTVPSLKSGIQG